MKLGVPWSVKGIRPEARETAKEAARRSGMSLGEWLDTVILNQAAQDGIAPPPRGSDFDDDDDDLGAVHERLDDLSHRIDQFTRNGPAAYAPRRSRGNSDQSAQLIERLDRRLDQFASALRANVPPLAPAFAPPSGIDQAVAEISARRRMLNGEAVQAPPTAQPQMPPQGQQPMQPQAAMRVPLPAQDLSGLEDQLRQITRQIETLRQPGVEQAIDALRGELGEIGRSLADAMPQRTIDAIEKQIQGLSQRIAEGRQAGADGATLSGIEHGLVEVRDALRGLTPAESLTGFNEAVAGLAQKIDLIVAQNDPATLQQLESAITTLRGMSGHIASNEAVGALAAEVQALSGKVEQMAMAGAGIDALNHLEHRINALSDALNERTQSGGAVPPRLEALVNSLADKIEQIQMTRGDNVAVGHLEDRIVKLVEKLDASDSRLGHLEAIERGLADLLLHIEDMRAGNGAGGLRANGGPGVDALKQEINRTQDALDAVHGTLGHMVDRLSTIEQDIRSERQQTRPDPDQAELAHPVGKLAVRLVSDAVPAEPPPPAIAAPSPPAPRTPVAQPTAAPRDYAPPPRYVPAKMQPIDPDLPPDQPLEPGSGPPLFRADASARIAASEAALGTAKPAAGAGNKSSFIAAARRAAHAAIQEPAPRGALAMDEIAAEFEKPSLSSRLAKRVKQMFVAASMIAIIIGSIQITATVFDSGNSGGQANKTADNTGTIGERHVAADQPNDPSRDGPAATIATNPATIVVPQGGANVFGANPQTPGNSILSAPGAGQSFDITGSISRPKSANPASAAQTPATAAASGGQTGTPEKLPIAIGGAGLRNAAAGGDAAAAYEIAMRYAEGRGVPVNQLEAARWFERAASKGLAPAQFRLAGQFEKGLGVRRDLNQARKLYIAAAAQGNAKAMHNLAVLYAEGIDGKPEYAAAVQWFRKAATRGVSDSEYNLAVLLARGLGAEKNLPESYKWFALAAAQGDQEAARKRDEVGARLGPEALITAEQAVKTFAAEPQPESAVNVPEPPGGWDQAVPAAPTVRPRPRTAGTFEVGKQ